MQNALEIHEISKRYGDFIAVDRFSLSAGRGEVLGFLGPNGAGKTSTIRMIMGITRPDSGTLRILGAARAEDVRDRVGYLPEERGLYRKMTVDQTLRYFGKLKGLRGAGLTRALEEQIERVGLGEWRHKRVETLSKGMSQKIQFICCILHKPDLLILDEPFSGLDPMNADLLERLLRELRAANVSVLFSTHQMETAERLCDRLALINRGKLLLNGTLAEIKRGIAARVLVIEGAGEFNGMLKTPGVCGGHVTDGHARLDLTADADPQQILASLLPHVRLTRFEVVSPTLQRIFVDAIERDDALRASSPADAT